VIKPSIHLDHFHDTNLVRKRRLLKHDANLGLQLVGIACRIDTQYRDFTAIARPETFENFHCRTLACAIRPKHREDLAGLNLEVDPLNGVNVPVTLSELVDMNDGSHAADITAI
jgi:hypothetical protein